MAYEIPVTIGEDGNFRPLRSWMQSVRNFLNSPSSSQGDIWRGKTVRATDVANNTTLTELGTRLLNAGGPGFGGAAAWAAPATTNYLTQRPRITLTTDPAVNNDYRYYDQVASYWRGNAALLGGFRFETDVGLLTVNANSRLAVGLSSAATGFILSAVGGNPSSLTDVLLLGCDSGETTLSIMHNDAAGTCTKVALGASFPVTATAVYRVVFACDPNGSEVTYEVTRLDVAASASGTLSTDLPTSTVFMRGSWSTGNGATATATAIAFYRGLGEQ